MRGPPSRRSGECAAPIITAGDGNNCTVGRKDRVRMNASVGGQARDPTPPELRPMLTDAPRARLVQITGEVKQDVAEVVIA